MAGIVLNKNEAKALFAMFKESGKNLHDIEREFNVHLWLYPGNGIVGSGGIAVESSDHAAIIKFAQVFSSCLEDGGLIAFLGYSQD